MPTYTLGRRQTAPLTDHEAARLKAPLHVIWPGQGDAFPSAPSSAPPLPVTILHSPRGGLTTYHGPGQAVLWPVLDLKSPHHRQFTVRCYSRLLEDTTIATLQLLFGLAAFTTADPGVWVTPSSGSQAGKDPAKIAALGVHLRRHVSALGTAINIAMPGANVVSEEMNPWARIVACGLEGKTVTSAAAEVGGDLPSLDRLLGSPDREEAVISAWAEELARRIGLDGVDSVSRDDVVGLVTDILSQTDDVTAEESEYVKRLQSL
jgi:lipoyl(octanoyl) transferase 2